MADKAQDLKAAGESLLHSAAEGGSAEIVGLLLEKGFDPARADRFGWTPLHYAARDGRAEAARVLIEKDAPLNARTTMGQTAYNVAKERAMEAAAALLAEKGADRSEILRALGNCVPGRSRLGKRIERLERMRSVGGSS